MLGYCARMPTRNICSPETISHLIRADERIKRIGKRNRDATLKKEKKKERKKNMDDKNLSRREIKGKRGKKAGERA